MDEFWPVGCDALPFLTCQLELAGPETPGNDGTFRRKESGSLSDFVEDPPPQSPLAQLWHEQNINADRVVSIAVSIPYSSPRPQYFPMAHIQDDVGGIQTALNDYFYY